MRNVLNISTVLACGLLAGVCGLIQGDPSRAASASGRVAVAADQPADPMLVPARKSGGGVEAHFAAANTSHDGHLTRQQALDGDWTRVARHFDEIDAGHRGWISAEQIHAFNKSHAHHRKTREETPA